MRNQIIIASHQRASAVSYLRSSLAMTVLLFVLFNSTSVEAVLGIQEPEEACALMKEQSLITRSWRELSGDEYGCTSPYKELGVGNPLANNLAYYVTGTRTKVTELRLVLNVNNRSAATSGHAALLKAAEVLCTKATGGKLPKAVENAITAGKPVSAKSGKVAIAVLRKDWPTGRGYEIHVVLE
jgi:hypothetical protein